MPLPNFPPDFVKLPQYISISIYIGSQELRWRKVAMSNYKIPGTWAGKGEGAVEIKVKWRIDRISIWNALLSNLRWETGRSQFLFCYQHRFCDRAIGPAQRSTPEKKRSLRWIARFHERDCYIVHGRDLLSDTEGKFCYRRPLPLAHFWNRFWGDSLDFTIDCCKI